MLLLPKLALSMAVVLAATASCLAEPTVKNTSTYVGAGRWDWTISVDADSDTLGQIECVEYTLHPTFPDLGAQGLPPARNEVRAL